MPIVGEGTDVHVEYSIPDNIKKLITDNFLKEFLYQLFRIHYYYSLDLFADEGIPMNTSTAGWFVAFAKACLLTNNEELLNYERTLPWYDSDIFDGELASLLVERRFILDDASVVIGKRINMKSEDILRCCECGKLCTSKTSKLLTLDDFDYDEDFEQYRCLECCNEKNNLQPDDSLDNYILNVLPTFDEKRRIISEELKIEIDDIVECSCCKKIYKKTMSHLSADGKYLCFYCKDLEETKEEGKTTDYYRKCIKEIDDYQQQHPLKLD